SEPLLIVEQALERGREILVRDGDEVDARHERGNPARVFGQEDAAIDRGLEDTRPLEVRRLVAMDAEKHLRPRQVAVFAGSREEVVVGSRVRTPGLDKMERGRAPLERMPAASESARAPRCVAAKEGEIDRAHLWLPVPVV